MSNLAKYDHQKIEDKWYSYWTDNNYFTSKPDDRDPYTIVIPPPNITGVLHMGHMLNNTIQDILVRRARLLARLGPKKPIMLMIALWREIGDSCSGVAQSAWPISRRMRRICNTVSKRPQGTWRIRQLGQCSV